jgi:type IV secretory pathway TraG/TraD family ATPase VirD4
MDAKLFYRQADFETAKDVAESLGYRSAYARSQTLREGHRASEGLSEQAVNVLTPRDISELSPQNVIALFSNRKPIWLKRMDWQAHPILRQRRALPPPPVIPLPPLAPVTPSADRHDHTIPLPNILWQRNRTLPTGYIDPDKRY